MTETVAEFIQSQAHEVERLLVTASAPAASASASSSSSSSLSSARDGRSPLDVDFSNVRDLTSNLAAARANLQQSLDAAAVPALSPSQRRQADGNGNGAAADSAAEMGNGAQPQSDRAQ